MVTRAQQALTLAEQVVGALRRAYHRVLGLFRSAKARVIASPPYQWLDTHVIDAPPVKATTFLGYVVGITVALFTLLLVGVWNVSSNVRQESKARIESLTAEVKRLKADNLDMLKANMSDYALLESSLKECRAMNAAPRAEETVIPKTKRRSQSSPRKSEGEGYRGPRPW